MHIRCPTEHSLSLALYTLDENLHLEIASIRKEIYTKRIYVSDFSGNHPTIDIREVQRTIPPVCWEVSPRLGTRWAFYCTTTRRSCFNSIFYLSTSVPFQKLEVTPLSKGLETFSIAILKSRVRTEVILANYTLTGCCRSPVLSILLASVS